MPHAVRSLEFVVGRLKSTLFPLPTTRLKERLGFTLIEFLIVLGVLAVAVGSALLVLSSVLRGTNQSNVTVEVKQNGQAVLDSLDSQIRNASDATSDGSGKYIRLTRPSADPLHIKCFYDTSPKSQNGWIGTVITNVSNPTESNYTAITNKNDLVAGVDINSCNFTVASSSLGTSSPPIVSVSFVASQAINAPSRQDFVASIKFQTTISLRKY
ncbi:type II secretion system protein [Candidatus Curtissbacteria bacterium]|nr:type II secretion system protein [Candidatus Curtissbacteria bacterium]